MKFYIPVILIFIQIPLYGQKILMDKDVSKAYQNIAGPNTKSFKQLFIGTGLVINNSQDKHGNPALRNTRSIG